MNDLYRFDISSLTWTELTRSVLNLPGPRRSMSLTALNSRLVMFGGENTQGDLETFRPWVSLIMHKRGIVLLLES